MLKNVYANNKIVVWGIMGVFLLFILATFFIVFIKPYPLKYVDEIKSSSQTYNIEKGIIASVIYAESGFYPNSKSNQGAIGLMQILPSTAEFLANLMKIEYSKEMLYEPSYNINMGTFYLKYLLEKFNNLTSALASYNAGEGNVKLWLLSTKYSEDGKEILTTPFPETNHYISKVLTANKYYSKALQKL